jgi:hypothetical protein
MPELGHELRWLAGQGAQEAQPMAPAEVMRCGDRLRRRRVLRDGFAAVAVAGAAVAALVSGTSAGPHGLARRPETRPSIVMPSPTRHPPAPTPSPSPTPAGAPSPSPSATQYQPTPTPYQPTPKPSPTLPPNPSPSPEPTASPSPQATPSPTLG